MDAHTRSWAALAIILALMASMLFAESSAVTASVHSGSSRDGSTQSNATVVTEGSGASGSAAASSSSTVNGVTAARSSQSTSVGVGLDALDQMAAAHFDRLSVIVDDFERFGFDASLVAEARSELAEQKQTWSEAETDSERQAVIDRTNAYWKDLRDRVRASGVSYDFDAEFKAVSGGGLTVASSSSSTGSGRSESVDATLNAVFNVADDAAVQNAGQNPQVERPSGFADGLARGFAGLTAAVGAVFNAWIEAVAKLF